MARRRLNLVRVMAFAVVACCTVALLPSGAEESAGLKSAQTLIEQEKYAAAIDNLNHAIAQHLNDAELYAERGLAHGRLNQMKESLDDCSEALRLNPKCVNAYIVRAGAFAKSGEFQKALNDCGKALCIDPNCADAYAVRGGIFGRMHQLEKSIDESNKALSLNPKSARALFNRANVYVRQGKFQNTIDDCSSALTETPNDSAIYALRGSAYVELGNFKDAESDLSKSIALDPRSPFPHLHRAIIYERQGEFQNEIDEASKAIALDSNFLEAYTRRGYARGELGQYKGEVDDCKRALSINPDDAGADSHSNLAYAYVKLGDYKQAIEECNKAIAIDQKFARAYSNRGFAYMNLCEYERALADLTTALNLKPNLIDALLARAQLYDKLGKDKLSQEDREAAKHLGIAEVIDLNKNSVVVQNNDQNLNKLQEIDTALRVGIFQNMDTETVVLGLVTEGEYSRYDSDHDLSTIIALARAKHKSSIVFLLPESKKFHVCAVLFEGSKATDYVDAGPPENRFSVEQASKAMSKLPDEIPKSVAPDNGMMVLRPLQVIADNGEKLTVYRVIYQGKRLFPWPFGDSAKQKH